MLLYSAMLTLCRNLSTVFNKLDSLRQSTVDRYTFSWKVHFQKMLSVTLTFEPTTLKMSPESCDKFHFTTSMRGEKMPTKLLIWPCVVFLTCHPCYPTFFYWRLRFRSRGCWPPLSGTSFPATADPPHHYPSITLIIANYLKWLKFLETLITIMLCNVMSNDLWPTVHLCPQLHLFCKFVKMPTSSF